MSRLGNLGRVDADSPAFTCLAFARLTAKAKSAPALPSEPKCSWRGRSSSDQLGKQGLAQVRRCVEFQLGGHVLSPRVRAQVASGPGVETLSGCDPGSLLPAPSRMRPFRDNFKPPLAPFAISPGLAFRGERSQISCPAKIAGAGARFSSAMESPLGATCAAGLASSAHTHDATERSISNHHIHRLTHVSVEEFEENAFSLP